MGTAGQQHEERLHTIILHTMLLIILAEQKKKKESGRYR